MITKSISINDPKLGSTVTTAVFDKNYSLCDIQPRTLNTNILLNFYRGNPYDICADELSSYLFKLMEDGEFDGYEETGEEEFDSESGEPAEEEE